MEIEYFLEKLKTVIEEKYIKINEPMSRHTTFRVGGNTRVLVYPESIEEVAAVLALSKQCRVKHVVVGNGSNIIVKDTGFDGMVLKTTRMNTIRINQNRMEAQCGAFLSSVSRIALENRLSGMEFLSGIPGTIGGAVAMNAGAYNIEIKDIIFSATVLQESGQIVVMNKDELMLSYRKSIIQENGDTVLSACFILKEDNYEEIRKRMRDIQSKRVAAQPLNFPNAGSIFKRINGQPVGAIIENAGLKNLAVGGAKVSEKHANFIVNTGNATAANIIELIEVVKKTVKEKADIDLVTEVKIIGD